MFGSKHGISSIGLAVAGVLWGLTPVLAQAGADEAPRTETRRDVVFVNGVQIACGPGVAGAMRGPPPMGEPFSIATEPRAGDVKSAPYAGVGTTEVVTTLADGNRIVRTNTMRYYRDSKGRTRTEYLIGAIGPFTPDQAQSVVTISDPIEGKRYVLHSALKRADIFPLLEAGMRISGMTSSFTTKGGVTVMSQKEIRSVPATAPARVAGAAPTVAPSLNANGNAKVAAAVTQPREVMPVVGVAPPVMVAGRAAGLPPVSAGFIMQYAAPASGADACAPNAKPLPAPTSLGERIIEGLKVTGSRMEFTIPSGAVGNEQPITVSSEQWFSPELGVVVSSTHRDPMMGDTTYKLEQVSRTEPDASLFAVPADYTQNDVMAGGGAFFEMTPPPGMTSGVPMGSSAGSLKLKTEDKKNP